MIYKSVENLRISFTNELVIIYIQGMDIAVANDEGDTLKISSMIEGYFVDVDEDYIYLADDDNGEITRCISHDVAKMIQIAPTEEEAMIQKLYEVTSDYNEDDGEFH